MNTQKKSFILNPFQRIAGVKALLWGLFGIVLTATLCSFTQLHFVGIMKITMLTEPVSFVIFLLGHLILWLLPAILFYLAGLILSTSKIRFIDVLGTFAFAQIPLVFDTLFGFIPSVQLVMKLTEFNSQTFQNPDIVNGSYFAVLMLPFVVWNILWLFQAYKTSCNLKGGKLGWSFAVLLISSDFICRILIAQLFKL